MSFRLLALFTARAILAMVACSMYSMPAEAGLLNTTAAFSVHDERSEQGLKSGLWHAEFIAEERHREESQAENRSGSDQTPGVSQPNADEPSHVAIGSVVESERQYFDDGLIMLLEETANRSELAAAKFVALSEWDKAVSHAIGSPVHKLKAEGPSLISVIVAVVGVVVVVGTYFRSSRTN